MPGSSSSRRARAPAACRARRDARAPPRAALGRGGELLAQVRDQRLHGRGILGELAPMRIDGGAQGCHSDPDGTNNDAGMYSQNRGANTDIPPPSQVPSQVGLTRLYNVASFEWSRVVQRGLLSGQSGRSSRGFRARASQFDAQSAAFPDGLMWHRRSDSRPTVDGGAHGPAHGSPSADCARVVRENEIQCPASDRRLRLSSASGAADTGCADAQQGRAAASPADDHEAAEN